MNPSALPDRLRNTRSNDIPLLVLPALLPVFLVILALALCLPPSFAAEWQPEVTISLYPMWSLSGPAVAAGQDGWVHIVWSEQIQEEVFDQVFYRTGTGAVWGDVVQLSNADLTMDPTLAIDRSGRVHVAWVEIGTGSWAIMVRRLEAGVWTPAVRVNSAVGREAGHPRLAADPDGTVHLLWEQEQDHVSPYPTTIYYSHWDGSAWSAQEPLTDGASHAREGAIAVAPDGTVHTVWQDDRTGEDRVYHRRFAGGSWSDAVMIGSSASYQHPDIAVTPLGEVWAVMTRLGYNSLVCSAKLYNGAWLEPSPITDKASEYPRIATSRWNDAHADVHIVWQEVVDGKVVISYLKMHPYQPDVRQQITDGTADAVHPAIAADPICNLDVAWLDNREFSTVQGVYYREGITAASDVPGPAAWAGPGAWKVSAGPNPFTDVTTLRFAGPKAPSTAKTLRIHDAAGRAVRSLPVGNGTVVWDGTDDAGKAVGTGVYLVRPDGPGEGARIIRVR